MFFSGDPHMVQGDGEVALTALEGSLRPTFRLALVKKGERGARSVAYAYLSAASDFQCSQVVDRRRASTRRSGRPTSPDPGCGWS